MADFAYYRPFDPRRYLRYVGWVFGLLVFGFFVLTTLQSRVMYAPPEVSLVGAATGCSLEPAGNPLWTTCGYFLNNASVALIAWLGGFALIGPFWVLWENTSNIGAYLSHSVFLPSATGWSETTTALAFLLPHGLFEIPAILLSIALGVYNAHVVFQNREAKWMEHDFRRLLRETAPWMVLVFGLLGIAAFVEANVSPGFAVWAGEL